MKVKIVEFLLSLRLCIFILNFLLNLKIDNFLRLLSRSWIKMDFFACVQIPTSIDKSFHIHCRNGQAEGLEVVVDFVGVGDPEALESLALSTSLLRRCH